MRNIVLLCQNGMSTSILVNKMKEAARDINYECTINAFSVTDAESAVKGSDIVLLGPQIRFQMKKLQPLYPDCIFEVIDMVAYGTMNGKKVIEQVVKVLGD